ncbi:hypothetical protein [Rhodococcus kronopolitis]|uniref:Uncharacterized protein n=1 Tax=Rhodococcus kronopolitis TaxID=1460226 RepID=A0ABV9FKW0_9NOCA
MTGSGSAARLLAEHAAALERIRASATAANLAAVARSRQLRSAATVAALTGLAPRAATPTGRVLRRADERSEADRTSATDPPRSGADYPVKSWLV